MPFQQLKDANYYIRILRQHLPEIREKYSVSYLGVFGSYVRGEQTNDSDLDILVEFEKVPGLLKYIEFEYYLSDLLGIKVDLVTRTGLKQNIGKRILNEVVSLWLTVVIPLNYAVLKALEIIGEAAKSIPDSLKNEHLEVPWKFMAGIRDKVVHGYFMVDLPIIWSTIKKDIPSLKDPIEEMLVELENR